MILVTGATGNVGNELVSALVARDTPVRAIARNPNRAAFPAAVEVTSGDLETSDVLTPALVGIHKVFLLGGFATTELLRQMHDAGVEHVVLLTSRCVIGGKQDNAITRMWLDAEAAVHDSGIPWTILRPSGFHSNALRWLPQLKESDVVRAPWPGVPTAAIDPADIAAVAATVLSEPGRERSAITLSGPQPLTPGEQVATLAHVLQRPLRYEPLSDDDARAQMSADTPAPFIDAFFRFFSDGEFDDSPVVDTVHQMDTHRARSRNGCTLTHNNSSRQRDRSGTPSRNHDPRDRLRGLVYKAALCWMIRGNIRRLGRRFARWSSAGANEIVVTKFPAVRRQPPQARWPPYSKFFAPVTPIPGVARS